MPRNRIIPYNPKLKALARQLRKEGTLAEVLLWRGIKGKQLGPEFHRQVPIGEYIVDFFSHETRLAIEIDGATHDSPEAHASDLKRQTQLESLGIHVLRFRDEDVKQGLPAVLDTIRSWVDTERPEDLGKQE